MVDPVAVGGAVLVQEEEARRVRIAGILALRERSRFTALTAGSATGSTEDISSYPIRRTAMLARLQKECVRLGRVAAIISRVELRTDAVVSAATERTGTITVGIAVTIAFTDVSAARVSATTKWQNCLGSVPRRRGRLWR